MNFTLRNLIVLSFFSLPSWSAEKLLDGVTAVVGDKAILQSKVLAKAAELKASPAMRSALMLPEKFTLDELREKMIEEAIVRQKIQELEIKISAAEVETQILNIAKQNGISLAQLEASLRHEGISPKSYRENIQKKLEERDFFDRVLRRGGGISEAELKKAYEERADIEVRLYALANKSSNPKAKMELQDWAEAFKLQRDPLRLLLDKSGAEEIGWIGRKSLDPKISKHLERAEAGTVVGPVVINGVSQVLIVDSTRKGSDEEFNAIKPQLMAQMQAEDYEKRIRFWVEEQKKNISIVRN